MQCVPVLLVKKSLKIEILRWQTRNVFLKTIYSQSVAPISLTKILQLDIPCTATYPNVLTIQLIEFCETKQYLWFVVVQFDNQVVVAAIHGIGVLVDRQKVKLCASLYYPLPETCQTPHAIKVIKCYGILFGKQDQMV